MYIYILKLYVKLVITPDIAWDKIYKPRVQQKLTSDCNIYKEKKKKETLIEKQPFWSIKIMFINMKLDFLCVSGTFHLRRPFTIMVNFSEPDTILLTWERKFIFLGDKEENLGLNETQFLLTFGCSVVVMTCEVSGEDYLSFFAKAKTTLVTTMFGKCETQDKYFRFL